MTGAKPPPRNVRKTTQRDNKVAVSPSQESNITTAFSCGARSAFKLNEKDYLRSMLSRRQLQGIVMLCHTIEFHN
jgi:hypothetical protein